MALINSPECNNQVSNTAASCPHCGAPIAEAARSKAAGTPLTTFQETSKRLKIHIIFSSIAFWAGILWTIFGINTPNPKTAGFSGIFVVGFRLVFDYKI